jgi:glycosyltransferase involved in cell wall biosynthesis
MIRVAFVVPSFYQNWMGGINYYRNLLYAIQSTPDKRIEPVLVIGNKFNPALLREFTSVETITTAFLDHFSPQWSVRMAAKQITPTDWFLEGVFRRHNIDVVSHYSGYLGSKSGMRLLGWIPDFQHVHYPEYFSKKELKSRNWIFQNICGLSSRVLLSSKSAYEDFQDFAPGLIEKARIMHFVSQPNTAVLDPALTMELDEKYRKYKKYYFLPNQFWKHKNHKVVFEAVKILKDRNRDITVLCSGSAGDYRNKRHHDELLEYLRVNHLEENIRILGMINSADLFYLMRKGVSVLNPSLFEGWSTTVEEAKSLGKNVILSDIPVHREQNPPGGVFFNPHDAEELATVLDRKYKEHPGGPDFAMESAAKELLRERTIEFAKDYEKIILEIAP